MAYRFEIVCEIRRDYRRFASIGTQFTVRLNPPTDLDLNLVDQILASVNDLFETYYKACRIQTWWGSLFAMKLIRAISLSELVSDGETRFRET
jgi:hypothetical protein